MRYIHLNALRAGLVGNMAALDRYDYAGHSCIMGKKTNNWQSAEEVLALFDDEMSTARRHYRAFVVKGIEIGRQPELCGGGLIRSAGGWSIVRTMRQAGIFQKSDERILGDSDFVETVLSEAQETVDNRYLLAAEGIGFEQVAIAVSDLLSIAPQELVGPSKERTLVKGRALVCYWAVRELGMSMTQVAQRLKIALPTVSVAVKKGRQLAIDEGLVLSEIMKM